MAGKGRGERSRKPCTEQSLYTVSNGIEKKWPTEAVRETSAGRSRLPERDAAEVKRIWREVEQE
jgi:hypothetical protein